MRIFCHKIWSSEGVKSEVGSRPTARLIPQTKLLPNYFLTRKIGSGSERREYRNENAGRGGLTYDIIALNCQIVCTRSRVGIHLGYCLVAEPDKVLVGELKEWE